MTKLPRPCTCNRCAIGGVYRAGDCWNCWKFHNDTLYRGLWGGEDPAVQEKLLLVNEMCPGDTLVMTSAIEALAEQCPGKYAIIVSSAFPFIFENNPHCVNLHTLGKSDRDMDRIIKMQYPSWGETYKRDARYISGYVEYLADQLGIKLKSETNRPHVYLSSAELAKKKPFPNPYVVINSGWKNEGNGELKNWGFANWAKVAEHLLMKGLTVVQVGEDSPTHVHRRLPGAVDMIGKTPERDIFLLAWHSEYGLGHESFLHHIYAAFKKPFVTLSSGIHMKTWTNYPTEEFLSRQGKLDCCRFGPCVASGHTIGCPSHRAITNSRFRDVGEPKSLARSTRQSTT